MRILLLVVYYLPSTMSSAKLIDDLAREFLSLGHDVTVAAPDQNIQTDCDLSKEGGVRVLRIKTGEIKSAPRWLRGWREVSLSRMMWRKGRDFFRENAFDLIVYYSPTIFFGPLVTKLREHYRCPSYLILRDIFPQWAVDAGVLRQNSMVYRFFKRKERENYEAATVIGVQSPANLHYFAEQGMDKKYRLEVLYNWAVASSQYAGSQPYREKMGLQDKEVFFYGGNIGVAQDMDNILRLAEKMSNEPSVYFLLVGEGSEVPRLQEAIKLKGIANILIHPPVDQDEYLSMLAEFDVGLISLDRGLKTQNFPGKMLSYMDQGKPILASVNPGNDLKEMLEQHQAGLVCVNGDDDQLAAFARSLANDKRLRLEMGRNARRLLEDHFSVSSAARQILSHFDSKK